MYAKKEYSQHGMATLGVNTNGKLRVQFPRALFDGKQKYMSLGLPDTLENRHTAQLKIDSINSDIINECFDPTLEKYKPKHKRKNYIETIKKLELPSILDLFDKYCEFKKKRVMPNTFFKSFVWWQRRLIEAKENNKELVKIDTTRAYELRDYLVDNYSYDSTERMFVQLTACMKWAIKRKMVNVNFNPYYDVLEEIKEVNQKKKTKKEIKYFTKEEMKKIILTFANDEYYAHYTPFVSFLFLTGCRPSEAVALHWSDIGKNIITFQRAYIETENGRKERKGLKREDERVFPLYDELNQVLALQKQATYKGEDSLVFPSPTDKHINTQNFTRRAWKKILKKADIQYRKPYTTRHTFITHRLEELDAKDIARICGNSATIIYQHYAGTNVHKLNIPNMDITN